MNTAKQHSNMLLPRLLSRGDVLEIRLGHLRIQPASGMEVPAEWLSKNESQLVSEMSVVTGIPIFQVIGHSVGNYGKGRYPGLHLKLLEASGCEDHYTIFNVITTRSRNTKHGHVGSPLPAGHFAVSKRSAFYNLWLKAGLPKPRRLSSFHDYLGKIQGLLFTGEVGIGNRVVAKSFLPAEVASAAIFKACQSSSESRAAPDNRPSRFGQHPDNCRTIFPDKHIEQGQVKTGVQPVFTTWNKFYDTGIQGGTDQEDYSGNLERYKGHTKQSEEEWLDEYEKSPSL